MSGHVNRTETVKQLLQTDEVKHRLSRTLEEIPFPRRHIERLHPTLVSSWKTILESQSVSWPWAMVMAMCLRAFLTPTAVLMPTTTSKVYTVLGTFLMHLGSTHSSTLIGLCRDVCHIIEDAVNTERALFRSPWKRQ